jgi:hypothetical protein
MKHVKQAVHFLVAALILIVSVACNQNGFVSTVTSSPPVASVVLPLSPTATVDSMLETQAQPTTTPRPFLNRQSENKPSGSSSAPIILLLTRQKGSVGDIYSWNVATQSLKQLTSWGYNFALRVSPDGKWLAYLSISQAAVSAMTQGQAMNAYNLANIWLFNIYTQEAIRIADQPQNATYVGGNLISRGSPVWSPDGTSVAWTEGDTHGDRVAIYTLSSKSTTTFPLNLAQGCCEGATQELYVGRSGIAITNNEGTPTQTGQVIYIFDTHGQQLARIAPGGNFFLRYGWITDGNNHEYLGGDKNGVLKVIDPAGNVQLDTPQGYPEMYNPNAPDGLLAYSVKYPSQWALTRQGQKLAEINDIWNASDISIAPDGQGIVYQQKVEGANVPGGKVFAYLINGQTIPIIPELHVLAVTWGKTVWRIHNQ